MVIWSGLGFLGLLIPFASAVLGAFLANIALGQDYTSQHRWPLTVGTIVGAGFVYLLSVRLDRPGKLLVDPSTGQRLVLKPRHTLFWIPLRWVALIAGVLGVFLIL